jgi:hypothetical protein
MAALAARIEESCWVALIFMAVCSVFIFLMFGSTFFSPDALKMRKTNYRKHDLNWA